MDLKKVRPVLMIFGLVVLMFAIAIMVRQTFSKGVPPTVLPAVVQPDAPFKITSPALNADGSLPDQYTCNGLGLSPPISIENAPTEAKEFVLIMHESKTNQESNTGWIVWNIPSKTTVINENVLPANTVVGTNDSSKTGYQPPCPAINSGDHQYIFDLYALSEPITLKPNATRSEVITAINGRVVAKTQFDTTVTHK